MKRKPSDKLSDDFYRQKLKEALGDGVEALKDADIEAKVRDYFERNPGYSRDAVHVAAIACRFKKEKVAASRGMTASVKPAANPRRV